MTAVAARPAADVERPRWRAVVVPSEHGGWGLTLEPVLLGLLIAPSAPGVALGLAAFVAFVVRTPFKLVLVDRWRHRWLPRTRLAAGIAGAELAVLVTLAVVAGRWSGWVWLVPVAIAGPLVVVEMWFDMRSRGRRLVPELCGSIGIASVAAAIAIAGGETGRLAVGLWLVIAARAVASIPFVRVQIDRLRHGSGSTGAQRRRPARRRGDRRRRRCRRQPAGGRCGRSQPLWPRCRRCGCGGRRCRPRSSGCASCCSGWPWSL